MHFACLSIALQLVWVLCLKTAHHASLQHVDWIVIVAISFISATTKGRKLEVKPGAMCAVALARIALHPKEPS